MTTTDTGSEDVGQIADTVTNNLNDLADLVTAASYAAGTAFAAASILKFKSHKDNPTQIPVGTPIALLIVSAALLFLPTILTVTGETNTASTG